MQGNAARDGGFEGSARWRLLLNVLLLVIELAFLAFGSRGRGGGGRSSSSSATGAKTKGKAGFCFECVNVLF